MGRKYLVVIMPAWVGMALSFCGCASAPQEEIVADDLHAEDVVEAPQTEQIGEDPQDEIIVEPPEAEAVGGDVQEDDIVEDPPPQHAADNPQDNPVEDPYADAVVGEPENNSAAVIGVYPISASPGTTVRVQANHDVFTPGHAAQIRIGEHTATIINHITPAAVDVLVPNMPAGGTAVHIVEAHTEPGAPGRLTVLPARTQQLVMAWNDGLIRLIATQPQAGHVRRGTDPGGRRLQYEVYNNLGRLLFRDVLLHPGSGRLEIFDEPESSGEQCMHRHENRTDAVFAVKIPTIPNGGVVRFFDVPAGIDLHTPAGRRQRVFLTAMSLEGSVAQDNPFSRIP